MKKFFALFLVVAVLFVTVAPCFSAEVFAPGRAGTGTIGTASKHWAAGYFKALNNARVGVSSHDYNSGSAAWTLDATEKESRFLFIAAAAAGATIVAPSEIGRIYTVYNKSGQSVTIKKSGGVGIAIAKDKVTTVIYATNDYVRITADQTF